MTRIPPPDWVSEYDRGEVCLNNYLSLREYEEIQRHRETFLAVVHAEAERYVNDHAFDDQGDDFFPHSGKLTGEYYIHRESYSAEVGPVWYKVCVGVACLQKPRPPHVPHPCDYLGLDVWLHCDPTDWSFVIYRNTDSSVR